MFHRNKLAVICIALVSALAVPWLVFGDGASSLSKIIAVTQSGTWTVQPGNTANTTAWKVDGSAVTQPVSLASVPSHAVTNAGTFATQADTELAAAAALADGTANPSVPGVGSYNMCFNGTTWDRCQKSTSGNGAVDANTQRVTIASDSTGTMIATQGTAANLKMQTDASGATASAVPSRANYMGGNSSGNLTGLIVCDKTATYDASTSGSTQLVALSGSTVIYICGYDLNVGGTATNVKLVYGTGVNCATSPANLTPAYQMAANGGRVLYNPVWGGLKTTAGQALCINASGANAVQGVVWYTQF